MCIGIIMTCHNKNSVDVMSWFGSLWRYALLEKSLELIRSQDAGDLRAHVLCGSALC